jgi:hypothetical protein
MHHHHLVPWHTGCLQIKGAATPAAAAAQAAAPPASAHTKHCQVDGRVYCSRGTRGISQREGIFPRLQESQVAWVAADEVIVSMQGSPQRREAITARLAQLLGCTNVPTKSSRVGKAGT